MFSHILFGILALLYYACRFLLRAVYGNPRLHREILRRSGPALDTLSAQYGGAVQRLPRHGAQWFHPDGSLIEIKRKSRATLTIQLPITLPEQSITFQRIPRLPYAFLEGLLPDSHHMGRFPYFVTSKTPGLLATLKKEPEFWWLFERITKAGFSLHMDARGLRAWKRMTQHDSSDIVLFEHYRLLRDFARFCCAPVLVPVHPLASVARCAYCHEETTSALDVICCASCGTPHHQECFELNGKCSIFGCTSMRPVTARASVAGM